MLTRQTNTNQQMHNGTKDARNVNFIRFYVVLKILNLSKKFKKLLVKMFKIYGTGCHGTEPIILSRSVSKLTQAQVASIARIEEQAKHDPNCQLNGIKLRSWSLQ